MLALESVELMRTQPLGIVVVFDRLTLCEYISSLVFILALLVDLFVNMRYRILLDDGIIAAGAR